MKPTYGICLGHRAGWRGVRARLEKYLPGMLDAHWQFVHIEDMYPRFGHFIERTGKLWLVNDVLSGRKAARESIRRGCTKILFGNYHTCPWIPLKSNVRYFIYADATMRQLAQIGYSNKKDISRAAKIIYGRGLKKIAAHGEHFLCMSRWYADALKLEHGAREEQITIVPPFLDTTHWQPTERPPFNGKLKALFIGADFRRKGGDILVEVSRLPEFQNVEWHLVTKSPPQPAPNLFTYTNFEAGADGLRTLVQSCDVLLLPTRADCSPNVICEAAACALPTIATDMAGIPDLVERDVTGTLIAAPTVENVVAALRRYLADPALLRSQGEAARQKAVRDVDTQVVLGRICGLFNQA